MLEPFFMTNPEWYRRDEESRRLVLMEKAPEEAIRSYNEFYSELDKAVVRR